MNLGHTTHNNEYFALHNRFVLFIWYLTYHIYKQLPVINQISLARTSFYVFLLQLRTVSLPFYVPLSFICLLKNNNLLSIFQTTASARHAHSFYFLFHQRVLFSGFKWKCFKSANVSCCGPKLSVWSLKLHKGYRLSNEEERVRERKIKQSRKEVQMIFIIHVWFLLA